MNSTNFNFDNMLSMVQESGKRLVESMSPAQSSNAFADAYQEWLAIMANEPNKLAELQRQYMEEHAKIFQRTLTAEAEEPITDKRFSAPEWQTNPATRYMVESYLTTSRLFLNSIDSSNLESERKKKLHFYAKQYLDAVSPSNFLLSNPEAIKEAIDSEGESLRVGMENLSADMGKGRISMTDETAFKVGENIALSPGSVVFENEVMQLIQYSPTTPNVYLRPLIIVPPCINKFYILDMRPENSFVGYSVAQGHTVFLVSWRNVGEAQSHLTWDDYIAQGVVKAIDVARVITNVEKVNILGFCVGGTLLSCAIAVLRRMGHDVVESLTLLTTFLDFSDVGEINAYIDSEFIEKRDQEVGQGGVVSGAELAMAFSSLRANELVWNYVVNNYLKGKQPPAFDLLYWNSDSTNLPGPWYCYYLRNTYQHNNLIKPDKLAMCGQPVDLKYVDMPAFVFAAREDHIVPWRTAFSSASYLGGEVEFVLGASGHIAGVVNPASKNKRSYWTGGNVDHNHTHAADKWLERAHEVDGSWWTNWMAWLNQYAGRKIPARKELGGAGFKPIEPAPGRYVVEKHE